MEKVQKYLDNIKDLPVLPEIANKVIMVADSPKPSVGEMSELIKKDPTITANILKLINSGYYTLRTEVTSVHQAVVLMGMKQVRNLVVTMITLNHFSEPGHTKIRLSDFWDHSLAVATIAQALSEKLNYGKSNDVYLGALLHDIGKLIVQFYYPILMSRIFKEIETSGCSMYDAEQKVLGFSHAELGSCLAERWKFPPNVQNAILHHHSCQDGEDPIFCAILQLSDLITKARLCAVFGDQNFDVVFEEQPCWQIICDNFEQYQDMDFARFLFEMDDEIEKARELVKNARSK